MRGPVAAEPAVRKRWYQLHLRTLLALTALSAIVFGALRPGLHVLVWTVISSGAVLLLIWLSKKPSDSPLNSQVPRRWGNWLARVGCCIALYVLSAGPASLIVDILPRQSTAAQLLELAFVPVGWLSQTPFLEGPLDWYIGSWWL